METRSTTRWLIPVGSRERFWATVQLVAGVGVCLALALWHPRGWVPTCPTYEFGGVYCPGCGSLRATHHLLNGQAEAAFRHNPLLVLIGVPLGSWFGAELFSRAVFGHRFRPILRAQVVGWAALLVLIAFAVLRNLPGAAFEGWRPPEPTVHSEP